MKLNKILSILSIACLFTIIACEDKIIEKEIPIQNSKIERKKSLTGLFSISNNLNSSQYISDVRDTLINDSIDLNFDGLNDVEVGFDIKNFISNDSLESTTYMKVLNSDFEFLYKSYNGGDYLTPFYDTNNYIAPSSSAWKLQSSLSKFVIFWSQFENCIIDNKPQLCVKVNNGFYNNKIQYYADFYYQGFRFKNKLNKGDWNYGYFTITCSNLSLTVYEIANETFVNKPIGIRSYP